MLKWQCLLSIFGVLSLPCKNDNWKNNNGVKIKVNTQPSLYTQLQSKFKVLRPERGYTMFNGKGKILFIGFFSEWTIFTLQFQETEENM